MKVYTCGRSLDEEFNCLPLSVKGMGKNAYLTVQQEDLSINKNRTFVSGRTNTDKKIAQRNKAYLAAQKKKRDDLVKEEDETRRNSYREEEIFVPTETHSVHTSFYDEDIQAHFLSKEKI